MEKINEGKREQGDGTSLEETKSSTESQKWKCAQEGVSPGNAKMGAWRARAEIQICEPPP